MCHFLRKQDINKKKTDKVYPSIKGKYSGVRIHFGLVVVLIVIKETSVV